MSYFPEDIPFMSKEELRENRIRIPKDATDTNVGAKISGEPLELARAIDGLTEWQKHVQTDSNINRDISVAIEALKAQLGTNLAEVSTDCISRQVAIDALWKALYEYEDKTEKQFQESDELDVGDWILHRIFVQNMSDIDRRTILELPSAQPEILACGEGELTSPTYPYSDLISRKETVKAIRDYIKDNRCIGICNVIERLPNAQPEPHWIPVKERLPDEEDSIFARYYGTDRWRKSMFRKKSREVIVTSVFEDGELHTEVAHTTDGEWHIGVNVVPRTVIAWMPLPEPYQPDAK